MLANSQVIIEKSIADRIIPVGQMEDMSDTANDDDDFQIEFEGRMALVMLNSKDKTSNEFIREIGEKFLAPDLNTAIYWRLKKGEKEYGHKIRVMDDTTTWGTKNNEG